MDADLGCVLFETAKDEPADTVAAVTGPHVHLLNLAHVQGMLPVSAAGHWLLASVRDEEQAGWGFVVSGPAARRALTQAANAPRFNGREVKVDFARKYLARDGAVLYDNPQAILLCLYKRDRALCAKGDLRDAPTLDRCVASCSNIVRTDSHATQLRDRAVDLDRRAARMPKPIGDRIRANATRLRSYADDHDRTRITSQETSA